MKLEQIITLANAKVRLRFLAMERSLRAVGCDLPLLVIPYDDQRFELPAKATWWESSELFNWLQSHKAHPTMRKYLALTVSNFQFVDADVCFLRNPAKTLEPVSGFITSCGHWHNPGETLTGESRLYLEERSTIWQSNVFNTGQWACDRALYELGQLRAQAEESRFRATCLEFRFHEQPGVNMLVAASGVVVTNLTLPPFRMQSTWAGDYCGEYRRYWKSVEETPYLIHWAGVPMHAPRPIDEIFLSFLTRKERAEWEAEVEAKRRAEAARNSSFVGRGRKLKRKLRAFNEAQ
ncbi:MAG TPA: hypothetical protein VEH27_17305 [Methylomirabilota bacterium]|nr:hypothetical protein [Methylomirabilota bacterium]